MNQQVIKQAINGIAKLLGSNPELLAEQLTGLKALLPGIDESAITRIVEKTKAPRFNPHDLEEEIGNVAAAVQWLRKDVSVKWVKGVESRWGSC
jgi:hypothetical protein